MISSVGLPGFALLFGGGDPISGAIVHLFGAMNFAVIFMMGVG